MLRNQLASIRYWLGVIALGTALGFGLQFAQAWTNPTEAPPGGNVAGPLTTSAFAQYKSGALGVGGLLKAYLGLDANAQRITNVAAPVNGTDAVNKDYVDAAGGGVLNNYFLVRQSNSENQSWSFGFVYYTQGTPGYKFCKSVSFGVEGDNGGGVVDNMNENQQCAPDANSICKQGICAAQQELKTFAFPSHTIDNGDYLKGETRQIQPGYESTTQFCLEQGYTGVQKDETQPAGPGASWFAEYYMGQDPFDSAPRGWVAKPNNGFVVTSLTCYK